jgi:hypothetical protein
MKNSPSKGAAAERIEELSRKWPKLGTSKQYEYVRNILRRVTVGQATVWIEVDKIGLLASFLGQSSEDVALPGYGWPYERHLRSLGEIRGLLYNFLGTLKTR